jgi:hypothetical protein
MKNIARHLQLHMSLTFPRYIAIFLLSALVCATAFAAQGYQIGVFYFPGWKDNQVGAPSAKPWEPIKKFPEREPLLGWYDEGSDLVMNKHIEWMQSNAINFVVFDWYYIEERKVVLEHALAAFMRSPIKANTKFSLLWANHSNMPKNLGDWQAMVRYWVKYYFPRSDYLRINDRPAIFIFSADTLQKQAATFGSDTATLLEVAQVIAKDNGFIGINFIAGTGGYLSMIQGTAKKSGYTMFSAYNYHQGPLTVDNTPSRSYEELDQGYRSHWQRFMEKGDLPLIVPMTSGWDKRPWGGSKDPLHDNSFSTPAQFEAHLREAKRLMDTNPDKTKRMGVVCCWNEFGEGSYIEPTKKDGFSYLEKVKKVFGTP